MLHTNYFNLTGTFKIITDCLCPPREAFKLRNLNKNYVDVFKSKLLQHSLSFAKPVTGIVKDLKDKSYFVEDQLESYEIEVIGGNHRMQALSELQQEGHIPESLKFVMSGFMQVSSSGRAMGNQITNWLCSGYRYIIIWLHYHFVTM